MNTPKEILTRAVRQRKRRAPAAPIRQKAAPQPAAIAPQSPADPPPESRAAAPKPAGSHALYRELMRSHDRMGTRHLSDPG